MRPQKDMKLELHQQTSNDPSIFDLSNLGLKYKEHGRIETEEESLTPSEV
ncbi:uncharacterized protein G2W53_016184 [Senna tora]|uniref:Uncharacterized protein n=1 Tax=Senna tora TaxID=362788 RepID=A0A835C952_9FABA|nr:uncharacterized protein G2W53_016184 [Senna tora]